MWARIKRTFRGDDHNAEIREELQFHLDMHAGGGEDPREARLRMGNLTRLEEETRAMGIVEWLDSAARDIRFALRQLRKTPALVAAVVLSLTLGIGANTAIFSLVDAAILRPLPVRNPDSLRILEWTASGFPPGVSNINGNFNRIAANHVQGSSVSAAHYRRLAATQNSFESILGVSDPVTVALVVGATPAEQVTLQHVSANFFQTLGVSPVIGRSFRDDEDRVGAVPVAVVSNRLWDRLSRSGADLADRTVQINTVSFRIVGVAPPGFFGLQAGQWTDIYAPLAARVAFTAPSTNGGPRGEDDTDWWVRQVARLKPGVSEPAAREQIAALFRGLAAPPTAPADPKAIPELITLPGRRGFDALNPRDANALWILMLLVAVLLLIVCANVANLLLSRSVGRARESAVRLALGAARSRLFRQHLTESCVLAILGGGAGLALGYVLAQSIHVLFQTGRDSSNMFDLHLDPRTMAYTAALSILTAFLFGLAPAIRAARANLGHALKANTRSVMDGRMRLPRVLVCLQIALCLGALVAAGLLGKSLANLNLMNVGFDRQNLAYASVNPSRAGYSPERVVSFVDRVNQELAALPGVIRVSTVQSRLLSGNGNFGTLNFPGRPYSRENGATMNQAGERYFETMRIPILAGRALDRRDLRPGPTPVVVDENFVRKYFPNENPLGRRFGLGMRTNDKYEIVGVAGNTLYNSVQNEPVPTFYEPFRARFAVHFVIRSSIDSSRLAGAVRKVLADIDPAVPLAEFHTQTGLIDRLLRTERLLGFLSGAFGLVALALAAIGLGGLIGYAVARRTNEIGVRMALGASSRDVVRMVIGDSLWMVAVGVAAGLPCAYAIGRFLKDALFRLPPLDPWTAVGSCAALLAVALAAAWIPARRASRIDPLTALREE
ncbi:MAG TPA: ABC transporter permease [Bryobacteraceae bacterium]|jgi:predicted permease|nr:ABC transporter permease [Bryobacteraceae bacterium]